MSNGVCSLFTTHDSRPMFTSYEESVLCHADAEGKLPAHVIRQLFDEHGSDFADYVSSTPDELWDDGKTVLNWLGY